MQAVSQNNWLWEIWPLSSSEQPPGFITSSLWLLAGLPEPQKQATALPSDIRVVVPVVDGEVVPVVDIVVVSSVVDVVVVDVVVSIVVVGVVVGHILLIVSVKGKQRPMVS